MKTTQLQPITPDEPLISLAAARQLVPPIDGKRLSEPAVRKWAGEGHRGVILPTRRIGGRIVTSERAVRAFLDAISEG